MSRNLYQALLWVFGLGFAVAFNLVVMPALLRDGDILGGFAAGFVNPYASGYALDAILCWCVLASWVAWERSTLGIRHGWIALLLGIAPGVATGFAFYLLLRLRQQPGAAPGSPPT
ncbi:hypothetical protein C3942_11985 [Solimonas fluminis]|uniref:DUF2834 domain-containing protein n=1 Tax=Solimonas fluminis TaxID=2086571 RepID=A0A2S5TEW9_9GAMM|nr:DUF2834 domain-containing protein [Solimonas fluminis]PPE73519.1 hypothetical protein C3942_11985 [Solimonas fluminis]